MGRDNIWNIQSAEVARINTFYRREVCQEEETFYYFENFSYFVKNYTIADIVIAFFRKQLELLSGPNLSEEQIP